MTGAAGGLAGGLWARYDATIVPGAHWVMDAISFDARLVGASAAITGEGRLDEQTLEGKAVCEVARRCRHAGVPVHALVGSAQLSGAHLEELGLASVSEAPDAATLASAAARIALATRTRAR
jgi:glycerate kinase